MIEGVFSHGILNVIVSKDMGLWHLSVSHPSRIPNYEELKEVRYKFLSDDIYVAQVFPPSKEFVNVHPHTLHLWQLRDTELDNYKRATG